MRVDFDRLRLNGAKSFNRLVNTLNRFVDGEDIKEIAKIEKDSFVVGDIYDDINDLRNFLATLLCLDDEEKEIKCIEFDLAVFADDEN